MRLPSEDELSTLPRWAVVAFAVRCAQRVQPLFADGWSDAPAEHVAAVDRAILLAQAAAADSARASDELDAAATAAARAARAAADARAATRAAADAARAAADVAYAARVATYAARVAAYSARAAFAAARAASAADAAWADFELLRTLSEREGWTDESSVAASMLGPLWPFGEPDWWPVRQQNPFLSPEFLSTLPPVSRVALAFRCAGRIRAIIAACETPPLGEYLPIIDEEIGAIEAALRTGDWVPYLAGRAIADLEEASDEIAAAANAGEMSPAYRAIGAVRAAIEAAEGAARQILVQPSRPDGDITFAYDAFRLSGDAVAAFLAEASGDGSSTPADIAATADAQALVRLERDAGEGGLKSIEPEALEDLWPHGPPDGWPTKADREAKPLESETDYAGGLRIGQPRVLIAWDPDAMTEDEYAELVGIVGDLARRYGAFGVQRVYEGGAEVPSSEGAVV